MSALLPLRGAYALSGRYWDEPGRWLIDELQGRLGASDLGGRIVVQHDEKRPRILVRLESRRLNLDELQPAGSRETSDPVDFDRPLEIGQLGAAE